MKYIFSAIFFTFCIGYTLGQTINPDSLSHFTDTIVVYKDPLVIRKKVFVAPPAIKEKLWCVELGISGGVYKNNFHEQPKTGISEKLNQMIVPSYTAKIGMCVFRKFTQWDIGLGIQLENYKEKFAYDITISTINNIPYWRTDTVDIY